MESQHVYKSFNISTTSKGVLVLHNSVNPTMSLNKIVTQSKHSASTGSPRFKDSATDLEKKNQIKILEIVKEMEDKTKNKNKKKMKSQHISF